MDLESSVIANVIPEIFKDSMKGIKQFADYTATQTSARDPLRLSATKYSKRLIARYGYMRIFGMNKPVPLTEIYVRVNILEKVSISRSTTVSHFHELFRKTQGRFGFHEATRAGIEAVNTIDRFVLLGKPGSGKTTFLKYVALQAAEGNLSKPRIPIFISLKDTSDSCASIMDQIVNEFAISGINDAQLFATHLLEKGKCIILLDGLDEVSNDQRPDIIRSISKMTHMYAENQYIVSCRIAEYNHIFDTFTDIEVADFGDREILSFVNNWFSSDPRKAKKCCDALSATPGIKDLASTPLLLTMLCVAYDETMNFSSSRAELYRDAIDALLKKWDTSRTIQRAEVYKSLTLKRKEELYSRIAAETFESEEYFWPDSRIKILIFDFMRH